MAARAEAKQRQSSSESGDKIKKKVVVVVLVVAIVIIIIVAAAQQVAAVVVFAGRMMEARYVMGGAQTLLDPVLCHHRCLDVRRIRLCHVLLSLSDAAPEVW